MKEEKKLEFSNLLKKRRQLSDKKKNNVKTVSSNDSQLVDIFKNFNESND